MMRKLAEVALGSLPNFKIVATDFALTERFLWDLFQMCAPPPKDTTLRNSGARHGDVVTFMRRA
jgi:hypothetical protein